MVTYDAFLNTIDGFGKYQISRFILICIAALMPPFTTYLNSFISANPSSRCSDSSIENDMFSNPPFNYTNQSILLEKCYITVNGTRTKCNNWVFDKKYYRSTLTEELSMVCDKSSLRANVQTVFFSGVLSGSLILGVLGDRYGRKPVLFISFIISTLASFGIAFGATKALGPIGGYIFYAVCRFFVGFATRGVQVAGYILGSFLTILITTISKFLKNLALELVGSQKRSFTGFFYQYFFPLGEIILVAFAYFIRDWQVLAIVAAIITIPFIGYNLLLPESPRW